jgi:hypothetical protein
MSNVIDEKFWDKRLWDEIWSSSDMKFSSADEFCDEIVWISSELEFSSCDEFCLLTAAADYALIDIIQLFDLMIKVTEFD